MTLLWTLVVVVGLAVATLASARAVDHAGKAAAGFGVPAFLIGFTLVAIGTDTPEIANSIAASVAGHGDINVGDSIGSAAAQATLAIGLIPLAARAVPVERRNLALLGSVTVAVVLAGTALMADGHLSRVDGLILVALWIVSIAVTWRWALPPSQPELPLPELAPLAHAATAIGLLVVVAVAATVAVTGLTRVAEILAIPEFMVSFFGQALGTSLPEVTVAISAARRGQYDLAFGVTLGASLADASLSLGSGPIIAPTAVTASLVVRGGLVTAAVIAVAVGILVLAGRHNRLTGVLLVGLYLATIPLLASVA